jgi:predicted nucleic acid-binding protein
LSAAPPKLLLDAGPLIALFHAADPYHAEALRGFRTLVEGKSRLIIPLPVLFEVYKWPLFEGGPAKARRALARMLEALEVEPLQVDDLEAIRLLLAARPEWKGTLEDASVALLALRLRAPVWTLNYRDLGVFKELSFWAG